MNSYVKYVFVSLTTAFVMFAIMRKQDDITKSATYCEAFFVTEKDVFYKFAKDFNGKELNDDSVPRVFREQGIRRIYKTDNSIRFVFFNNMGRESYHIVYTYPYNLDAVESLLKDADKTKMTFYRLNNEIYWYIFKDTD